MLQPACPTICAGTFLAAEAAFASALAQMMRGQHVYMLLFAHTLAGTLSKMEKEALTV
jgi:hypothetical protein